MESSQQLQKSRRSIMRVNRQSNVRSRRHRAILSCATCRKRKIRCDRLTPCSQCVKSKIAESCYYPAASTTSSPVPAAPPPRVPVQVQPSGQYIATPPTPTADGSCDAHDLEHLESQGQVSDEVPSSSNIPNASWPWPSSIDPIQSLPSLSFRGKNQKTRFFGRSHWAMTLSMFPDLNAHLRDYHREKQNPTNSPFAEYLSLKRLKNDMRLHENQQAQVDRSSRSAELERLIPSRALADYLIDLYFSTFENTLRILHVPSFMNDYNAFWISRGERSGSKSCTDVFAAKLLALMTCTSCFADSEALASAETDPDWLKRNSKIWIRTVASWVGSATNYAQLSLGMIQVKCLLLIARQAIAWEGDLTGMSSGFLMREAVMMGLHRDPVNFPNISPFWAEIRRRLWLTISELELQTALYSGVPVAISWDEFDCNPPSNVEDEDLLVESTQLSPSKPINVRTRTSFQIALAQTLQARLQIAKLINSIRFNMSYEEVNQLSEALTTGLAGAPAELQANPSAIDEHSGNPNHSLIFRRSLYLFLVYRCLLALHRPFFLSLAESHNEQYVVSRRLCVQASLAVLSQLKPSTHSVQSISIDCSTSNYPYLLRLRGGMFRDDIFHAAASLCFELRLQAKDSPNISFSTFGPIDQNPSYYQRIVLFQNVENAIKYFEFKVRTEKRTCKAYMLLRMLLASAKRQGPALSLLPQLGGGVDNEDTLTLDDACPRAARRCRDLLLAGETNLATSSSGPGGDGDNIGLHVPYGQPQANNTRPSQQTESPNPAFVESAAGNSFEQLLSDWDMSLDPMSLYLMDSWQMPPDSFEGFDRAA